MRPRYAVTVEAHGSQTGEGSASMKKVLASTLERAAADEPDAEVAGDVERAMAAPRQPNISFAFTATPKGRPRGFHTYPMRQAIEEGFILDVLCSYTSYSVY